MLLRPSHLTGFLVSICIAGCVASSDAPRPDTEGAALSAGAGFGPMVGAQAFPFRLEGDHDAFQFLLVDVNGDKRPDLVRATPGGAPSSTIRNAFGTSDDDARWQVWLNTGTALSVTPIDFSVPELEFGRIDGKHWSTVDIDGDGFADLVETSDRAFPYSGDKRVFGWETSSPYWKVHRGNGSGFAKDATQWSVPVISDRRGLFARAVGNEGATDWKMADLDGDGREDLVITGENGVALRSWRVHRNTGSAFAAVADPWTFPAGVDAKRVVWDVNMGAPNWLVDMTGDGRPDYVEQDIMHGTLRVLPNNGRGFSTPQAWSVPTLPTCNGRQAEVFTLVDVDGDRRPDLVSPGDTCGDVVWNWEAPYWKVYKNLGTNLAPTATPWKVPRWRQGGIASVDSNYFSAGAWASIDFNHDGALDLVMLERSAAGALELRVHPGAR